MAGPKKDWNEGSTAKYMEVYYAFLEKLWEEKRTWLDGKTEVTLREYLLARPTEKDLRDTLALEKIVIPDPVRIVLVDTESAQIKKYEPEIKPEDDFYVLVLPPKLRRETSPEKKHNYMEIQAWRAAYYHAFSDGYGM